MAIMLIDMGHICRICRLHCRDTKGFPVVPRLALVSIISVSDIMVRLKQCLKVPQSFILLCYIFWYTLYVTVESTILYHNIPYFTITLL